MDSDQGKLFVGGISWETTEEKLNEYFNQFGEVSQTAVMKDKITGRPRGFGFVLFSDPSVLDLVLQEKHTIDGRMVEVKRALSREEQQSSGRSGVSNTGRTSGAVRTKKIFVGGLPSTLTEDEFREYFETYGSVTDAVIMFDQNTQRPRGFGFISFDAEEAVDRVLHKTYHDLNGKKVEVKRALPKDANIGGGNRNMGGSYQSYDGQMDANRYMQPPGSAGGFQSYGSSGYGAAAGYGYGAATSGMGYGNYGGLGGAAYGNPNVPSSGYPQSATRGQWSSQAPSGYGMGYGSAPSGQSPGGVAGYGTQGYGYGGYMGANGGYGASGARGPEMHGNSGGGGYGDVNGNSAWRSQQ